MNQARSGFELVIVLSRIESPGCGILIVTVPIDPLLAMATCKISCPLPLVASIEGVRVVTAPPPEVNVISAAVGGVLNPIAIFSAVAVTVTNGLPE